MQIAACPKCGTRNIRASRVRTFSEQLRSLVGIFPFRCRQCGTRFAREIWSISSLRYARCPKCLRTDLSSWSERYYHPPFTVVVKLGLGAKPLRCETCRCNFASFRLLKERFSWHRRELTKEDIQP